MPDCDFIPRKFRMMRLGFTEDGISPLNISEYTRLSNEFIDWKVFVVFSVITFSDWAIKLYKTSYMESDLYKPIGQRCHFLFDFLSVDDLMRQPDMSTVTPSSSISQLDSTLKLSNNELISLLQSYFRRNELVDLSTIGDGIFLKESTLKSVLGIEAGRGVFASRFFVKGQRITEYIGQEVNRVISNRLKNCGQDSHVTSLEFQFSSIAGLKIPEAFTGGASFVNDALRDQVYSVYKENITMDKVEKHILKYLPIRDRASLSKSIMKDKSEELESNSNRFFKPNSRFLKVNAASTGASKLFIVADRDILPGEEIFISYSRNYWSTAELKRDLDGQMLQRFQHGDLAKNLVLNSLSGSSRGFDFGFGRGAASNSFDGSALKSLQGKLEGLASLKNKKRFLVKRIITSEKESSLRSNNNKNTETKVIANNDNNKNKSRSCANTSSTPVVSSSFLEASSPIDPVSRAILAANYESLVGDELENIRPAAPSIIGMSPEAFTCLLRVAHPSTYESMHAAASKYYHEDIHHSASTLPCMIMHDPRNPSRCLKVDDFEHSKNFSLSPLLALTQSEGKESAPPVPAFLGDWAGWYLDLGSGETPIICAYPPTTTSEGSSNFQQQTKHCLNNNLVSKFLKKESCIQQISYNNTISGLEEGLSLIADFTEIDSCKGLSETDLLFHSEAISTFHNKPETRRSERRRRDRGKSSQRTVSLASNDNSPSLRPSEPMSLSPSRRLWWRRSEAGKKKSKHGDTDDTDGNVCRDTDSAFLNGLPTRVISAAEYFNVLPVRTLVADDALIWRSALSSLFLDSEGNEKELKNDTLAQDVSAESTLLEMSSETEDDSLVESVTCQTPEAILDFERNEIVNLIKCHHGKDDPKNLISSKYNNTITKNSSPENKENIIIPSEQHHLSNVKETSSLSDGKPKIAATTQLVQQLSIVVPATDSLMNNHIRRVIPSSSLLKVGAASKSKPNPSRHNQNATVEANLSKLKSNLIINSTNDLNENKKQAKVDDIVFHSNSIAAVTSVNLFESENFNASQNAFSEKINNNKKEKLILLSNVCSSEDETVIELRSRKRRRTFINSDNESKSKSRIIFTSSSDDEEESLLADRLANINSEIDRLSFSRRRPPSRANFSKQTQGISAITTTDLMKKPSEVIGKVRVLPDDSSNLYTQTSIVCNTDLKSKKGNIFLNQVEHQNEKISQDSNNKKNKAKYSSFKSTADLENERKFHNNQSSMHDPFLPSNFSPFSSSSSSSSGIENALETSISRFPTLNSEINNSSSDGDDYDLDSFLVSDSSDDSTSELGSETPEQNFNEHVSYSFIKKLEEAIIFTSNQLKFSEMKGTKLESINSIPNEENTFDSSLSDESSSSMSRSSITKILATLISCKKTHNNLSFILRSLKPESQTVLSSLFNFNSSDETKENSNDEQKYHPSTKEFWSGIRPFNRIQMALKVVSGEESDETLRYEFDDALDANSKESRRRVFDEDSSSSESIHQFTSTNEENIRQQHHLQKNYLLNQLKTRNFEEETQHDLVSTFSFNQHLYQNFHDSPNKNFGKTPSANDDLSHEQLKKPKRF